MNYGTLCCSQAGCKVIYLSLIKLHYFHILITGFHRTWRGRGETQRTVEFLKEDQSKENRENEERKKRANIKQHNIKEKIIVVTKKWKNSVLSLLHLED